MIRILLPLLFTLPHITGSFPDRKPDGQTPRIRVLLGEDLTRGTLQVSQPLHLVRPGEKRPFRLLPPFPGKSVTCRSGGIRIGTLKLPAGEILLVPDTSGALRWNGKAYSGSLLLRPSSRDQFHVINITDLENYVTGVLPTEMGSRASLEALKAQAVCARTYAYMQMQDRRKSGFDTYADVRDQVYGGIPSHPVFSQAVQATRGQLLQYQSRPFKTYFHSTCGGRTESIFAWRGEPEIEPLAGTKCGSCSTARWFRWTTVLSREDVATSLSTRTRNRAVTDIKIRSWNENNRVKTITVGTGNSDAVQISGADFRSLLGANRIRSTRWSLTPTPEGWSFLGKGWGHGVGLCQEGAMKMGRDGRNFRQILSHYYPGAETRKFYR